MLKKIKMAKPSTLPTRNPRGLALPQGVRCEAPWCSPAGTHSEPLFAATQEAQPVPGLQGGKPACLRCRGRDAHGQGLAEQAAARTPTKMGLQNERLIGSGVTVIYQILIIQGLFCWADQDGS